VKNLTDEARTKEIKKEFGINSMEEKR